MPLLHRRDPGSSDAAADLDSVAEVMVPAPEASRVEVKEEAAAFVGLRWVRFWS